MIHLAIFGHVKLVLKYSCLKLLKRAYGNLNGTRVTYPNVCI